MDIQEFLSIKHEPEDCDTGFVEEEKPPFDFNIKVEIEEHLPRIQDVTSLWTDLPKYQPVDFEEDSTDSRSEGDLKQTSIQMCKFCNACFFDSYSLIRHNLSHLCLTLPRSNLYQCDYCMGFFHNKCVLTTHIHLKHFVVHNRLDLHKSISKSKHKCYICNKIFNYNHWHGHMVNVHSGSKYGCEKCNRQFKSKTYLDRHKLYIHGGYRPSWRFRRPAKPELASFQCEQCAKLFYGRSSLTCHMKNVHPRRAGFKCEICKSVLKSATYLRTHTLRVHYDDGKQHECDQCHKKFKSPRYLKIHKKNSHTKAKVKAKPEGNYKCEKCNLSFSTDSLWRRHVDAGHISEFKCELCNKCFKTKQTRVKHMKMFHSVEEIVNSEPQSIVSDSKDVENTVLQCKEEAIDIDVYF